jgi:hypothetical protein
MLPWTSSRRALVGALAAALLAGVVAVVVLTGRDGDAAARATAERYLRVLSDGSRDPAELDGLLAIRDEVALERADTLLAQARERISDVSLGESRESSTARSSSRLANDLAFDRFESFEVRYRVAGERHRATITLGLPRNDTGWLVVTPLSGEVDWNAAAWGTAQLDLTVGEIAVTEPGRTTYEPDAQLVHPGVYPVRASVGEYFVSPETDLAVAAGSKPAPLPRFDLAATAEGTATMTRQTLAAFEPCSRGTAYCPAAALVDDDPLPAGWWHGFATEPTVTVDGTTITLSDGAFRYASASGVRTVRFGGTGQVTVDPRTGEPGVGVPLELERR